MSSQGEHEKTVARHERDFATPIQRAPRDRLGAAQNCGPSDVTNRYEGYLPVTSLCHYLKNGPASSTPFYVVPALPQLPARQVSAIQSADSTRMAVAVGNSVELIRLAESVAWIPRLKWRQDHRGAVVVRARNSPGAPAMCAYTDLNYRAHTARDRLGARRHLAPFRLGPLESRCKISLLESIPRHALRGRSLRLMESTHIARGCVASRYASPAHVPPPRTMKIICTGS